jgi:hypothetical protein
MKRLTDTSPEAERVQAEVYRAISPARKWQIIEQSRQLARMLHEAAARQRNPGATTLDLHRSWLRATLGELTVRVSSWETGLEGYRLGGEISDRQWSDVVNVMRVQGDQLDQDYLSQWAAQIGVSDLFDRIRSETS